MTSNEFNQLLAQHKLYLSSKGTKGLSLAIVGEDFSNSKFPKINFSKASLVECDFSNTTFVNCTFTNSELVDSIFSNTIFDKSTISGCDVRHSRFFDVQNLGSVVKFLRVGKTPIETPDFFLT